MCTHTPQKRTWKEATEQRMTGDAEPKNTRDRYCLIAVRPTHTHTHTLHVTRLAKRPPRRTPGFIPKI